jgi:hypothetical protein
MVKPLSTTGIGSVPFLDAEDACSLIFGACDIPFWPQLPRVSFKEFMVPQFSEGMPFLRIDPAKQVIWVEKDESDELVRFYEGWSEAGKIAISEDYAKGLHTFLRVLKRKGAAGLVKGQVTGPLTFTLGLKDRAGKSIYFDEELREVSLMLLKGKAIWQIEILKAHSEGVVLFIDEPILSALGSSSYLAVSAEEALRLLREIVQTIKAAGGVSGIHCCGNADWPLVIRSGAEIINFDAYDYINTLALYPDELRDFLEKGGRLAWGIVPTSDAIAGENPESIKARFEEGIGKLSSRIPESLLRTNLLLTPSCGTGSRTVEETLKVFQLLMGLKESLA